MIKNTRFGSKKLSVSTWEEQQYQNYEYSANLTPAGRLAYLKELNDKVFGVKETKPIIEKKIKFVSLKH